MHTRILEKNWSNTSRALIIVMLCCASALAQEAQIYVSSEAGDRLTAKPAAHFAAGAPGPQALKFEINGQVTYQKITGFGASFMEAGLMVINTLPAPQQEEVLRAMFDPQQGAGFTAMKTPIASTDFMSAGPFYSYDPVPGDVEMKHFSIARDLGPNGVITYIKRARKYGNFVLQAPMDYPPDWMLFNPDTNQDVNPKYYDALARYYLRYLQEYQKNGVFIDYLSLFNEPGVYTKIPYGEIRILLRDHVGPLLEKSGLKTRLMLSESGDRDDAFTNYPLLMEDPEARKYVAVMPYHGYDFKEYSKMAELHRRYPEAPLWMTEVCYAYQAGTPKTLSLPVNDFADGDFWGQQIFGDLENYASAWIYWNAVLDEKGGPWAVSYIHGNPDPNIQHPVIIINQQTHQVTYTGLYYYLAHFSKFVRPGAVRIETTGQYPGVRAISFKTPEGKTVSELMNSRKEEVEVAIMANGQTLSLHLPAVSITTAVW
ncbi:MAG TPA: glycoside hydrolase family 30 beta sandwich domain-containing protein [Terriglobales bacterium]